MAAGWKSIIIGGEGVDERDKSWESMGSGDEQIGFGLEGFGGDEREMVRGNY